MAGYEIKEGAKMKNRDLSHEKYPNGRSQGKMLGQCLFGTTDRFRGTSFFHSVGWGNGLGMIQLCYIIIHLISIIITSAPPQIIRR